MKKAKLENERRNKFQFDICYLVSYDLLDTKSLTYSCLNNQSCLNKTYIT